MSPALRLTCGQTELMPIPNEQQRIDPLDVAEPLDESARLQKIIQIMDKYRPFFGEMAFVANASRDLRFVNLANTHLSVNLTLADLRATEGNALRSKLIECLHLQKSIDEINKYFPFFERLKRVSYETLEKISLISLQIIQVEGFKKSLVEDALIEDEAFIAISVQELIGRRSLRIFAFRMNQIYQERRDLLDRLNQIPFKRPWFWQSLQIPAAKVSLLSAKDILAIKNKLPLEGFRLLTDDQIKSLDLSNLSSDQIVSCIQGMNNDKETIQRRFSILSPQQLAIVINQVKCDIFTYFPIASCKNIDVEIMTREQIKEIFCHFSISENEQKQRIAMLPPETINAILPKLDKAFLIQLSDAQIRGLDYSKIEKKHLEGIFCHWRLESSQKYHKISLIPLQFITSLVTIAEPDFLNRLSTAQLASLNFDLLNKNQIERIFFNWKLTQEKKKERIVNLPMLSIHKLIQRGLFIFLKYLSDMQLQQINLKNISHKYVDELFPSLEPPNFFSDHIFSIKMIHGRRQYHWEKKNDKTYRIVFDDDSLNQEILQRKATCERNFQRLTAQQFADIRDQISPEVLAVLGC